MSDGHASDEPDDPAASAVGLDSSGLAGSPGVPGAGGDAAPIGDVNVRAATADDVPLLGPIELRAGERFREAGMTSVADDEPFPDSYLLAEAADGRLWVAELDGVVVGYVLALDLDGQAHLEQVSVVPEAGGRGIGAALVDVVVAWACDRGRDSVTLSTFRELRFNGPWYRKLGFVELDESELDDRLLAVAAHEAAAGLDMSARVFMRKPVAPPAA